MQAATSVSVAVPPPRERVTPAAGPPPRRARVLSLVPSAGPGLLMLCLGLIGANRPVLSWDEVTTADVAQRSPAEIWHLAQNIDAVFGAYYLFMHAWTGVAGHSEVALRLPSIVAMAAAVAVAAELGRRLFDPAVAVLTGLFLTVLPNTSRYAAEARPYAFACLFSVLALLALVLALDRNRPGRWALYGLTVVLLGLSHLVALTTLAAHVALVAGRRSWRTGAVWAATLAAALVPLVPLVLLGAQQQDQQLAWVDAVTLSRLAAAPGEIAGSPRTAWLLIGLALLASWRPASRLVPVTLLAVAPVTVVALVSVLISPMWVPRYLLIALFPLAMLAAVTVVGLLRAGDGGLRVAALRLGLVLAVLAVTAYPGQRSVRAATAKNGPDYRGIAAVVQRHQEPGDGMVFEVRSRAMRAGLEYYLRRQPTFPRDLLQSRSAADAGTLRADEHPDAAARVAGTRRVWLFVGGARKDPATGYPALRPLLRERYERIGIWPVRNGTVALYRYRG